MKLSELLNPRLVLCGLRATTHVEVWRELIELLVAETELTEPETLLEAVWRHECPNNVPDPIAWDGWGFPHARTPAVDRLHLAVGTSPQGIAGYGAGDGTAVRVVTLFLCPPADYGHLAFLKPVGELMEQPDVVDRLAHARDGQAFVDIVDAAGVEMPEE